MKVTLKAARKLYEVVGHGLVSGLGKPEPGQMCVKAAVAYSLGYMFNDRPTCVGASDREFAIKLNDALWSSNPAANAYAAAARDEVLSLMAKIAVDAYRKIGAPGIALLDQIKAGN